MTSGGAGPAPGADYGLLPRDRSFAQSLPAFLIPFVAYVALPALLGRFLSPEASEAARFAVVASLLWFFRKDYRFGPALTGRQFALGAAAALAAIGLWILCYRLALALPWWRPQLASAAAAQPSDLYWLGRTLNSVLLVPVFEELFCRAWLGEMLYGVPKGPGSYTARLGNRMDDHPVALSAPPLSCAAVIGCTLVFAAGHNLSAWAAAAVYFLFTTWLYRKTGSFRACVLVHALVNLGLAALVRLGPEWRYLWF